jgi:hypothetical protein
MNSAMCLSAYIMVTCCIYAGPLKFLYIYDSESVSVSVLG